MQAVREGSREAFFTSHENDGRFVSFYGDNHPDFAGIHFTGSTNTFHSMWKTVSNNLDKYKSYPRLVGETGGKDFVLAYKGSQSWSDVASKTGMAESSCKIRTGKLRKLGVNLPKFSRWTTVKHVDVAKLNAILEPNVDG